MSHAATGKNKGSDDPSPTSLVLRAPYWLFSRWSPSGARGAWDHQLTGIPTAVVAHCILPQARDGQGKIAALKVYGWWHYYVQELLSIQTGYKRFSLLSKMQEILPTVQAASDSDQMLPKLLALHPRFKPAVQNTEQLWQLVTHMLIAASLSGRVLVWPQVECLSQPVIKQETFDAMENMWPSPVWDPNYITYGPTQDVRCLSTEFMSKGCNGIGL